MERLFGVPVGAFATALVAVMVVAFGVIAVCVVRNRVFLRMATRNATRRRARSALIVGGLMLATAIIGAPATGSLGSVAVHRSSSTSATSSRSGAREPTVRRYWRPSAWPSRSWVRRDGSRTCWCRTPAASCRAPAVPTR